MITQIISEKYPFIYLRAGLAGEIKPVGVRGLEPVVPFCGLFKEEVVDGVLLVVGVRRGILDGVASSS